MALNFLEGSSLTTRDVEIVYLGSVPDLIVGLEEGVVDAIAANGYLTKTQQVDVEGNWRIFGELGQYSPGVDAVWAAKSDVTEEEPEIMEGFRTALNRAVEYVADNPDDPQLREIMAEWYGGSDPGMEQTYDEAVTRLSREAELIFGDFSPNSDAFADATQEAVEQGEVERVPASWEDYVVDAEQ